MKLSEPNVGPIVGATTSSEVRIFGRGEKPNAKYSHGVLKVTDDENNDSISVFKLHPDFDFTGVGIIENLKPNTRYSYQWGWFESNKGSEAYGASDVLGLNWDDIPHNSFVTASDHDQEERCFYVGSCRYNVPWASEHKDNTNTRGDKTFRNMLRQLKKSDDPIHGLLMLGDQIYADLLGKGVKTRESFYRLYRGSFRQESLRKLMSCLPTYMTLDDHEIEDNWPNSASDSDLYGKFVEAMIAYQAYQFSHSPALKHVNGKLVGTPDHWYYWFVDGCCAVFMADSRTERDLEDNTMFSDEQLSALKHFLLRYPNHVKVVAMGVPFCPDGSKDKWNGFPEQRLNILKFIEEQNISKVVFLGGDLHLSAATQISSSTDPDFKVLSVVASPFFWPFPHKAKAKFRDIVDPNSGKRYRVDEPEIVYRKENFVKLKISLEKVEVEIWPRKGDEPLPSKSFYWEN